MSRSNQRVERLLVEMLRTVFKCGWLMASKGYSMKDALALFDSDLKTSATIAQRTCTRPYERQ